MWSAILRGFESPHHRADRTARITRQAAPDLTEQTRRFCRVAARARQRFVEREPLERLDFCAQVHRAARDLPRKRAAIRQRIGG